ncbi:MAG: hypothetical protein KDB00_09900, partial [Planctomycetales bacterium]|nr:hypothetical protein [Planctomycetales bacterium]
ELVPDVPEGSAAGTSSQVTAALIADYEAALDLYCLGDHDQALKQLRTLPPWDGPTQFLIKQILTGPCEGDVIDLPK